MNTSSRRSGLLIPLFSAPSSDSWGIGDIGDVEPLSRWLAAAGQHILQLLPLNEMAAGQQLLVYAGKRHTVLKGSDFDEYRGERGRRGNKLPRGFQNVDRIEVQDR